MVFGPIVGYIPQYFLIQKSQSVGSFSPMVSYVLIMSMYTRMLYWYWARFELPLFFQAFVMLVAQCLILNTVIKITKDQMNEHNALLIRRGNSVMYAFIPSITLFFLLNFALQGEFVTDVLGIVALVLEACLPVPQCYSNFERKSTAGLSMFMIYTWVGGDSFKVFYYATRNNVPTYFLVCGCFQLSVDVLIMLQHVCLYGEHSTGAGAGGVSGIHDSDENEIQNMIRSGGGARYAPVRTKDTDDGIVMTTAYTPPQVLAARQEYI